MKKMIVMISALATALTLQAAPALAQQEPASLDQYSDDRNRVTLGFELAVEGPPPEGTTFFGFVPAEGGISTQLTDPDGDGLYTGSMDVPQYPPGPRPVPEGIDPVTLPVQIVQATETRNGFPLYPDVIKDFGQVLMNEDKTFSASISFEDPGKPDEPGQTTPEPTTPEPTTPGPNTPGPGGGTSGSDPGSPGVTGLLPDTGGFTPTVLGALGLLVTASLVFAGLLSTGLLRKRQ